MNDLVLYELLRRKERNELNPEEVELLNEWYHNLEQQSETEFQVEQMKTNVWTAIQTRLFFPVKRVIPWTRYVAAASIILFMLGTALYITHTGKGNNNKFASMRTIKVPHNEQMRLTLGDGSVIWLNGDAELDYPVVFDQVRNVYLKQGEAFFEVARDTTRPFIVHSGQLHTKVLGTSFDIRNRNGQYTVAVASGKVKVYYSDKDKEVAISPVLSAGERLMTGSKGNQPIVDKLDKTLYKGWTDQAYKLKDVSLAGIAFCMESIYGVNIRIHREELKQLLFTTSFSKKESITEILSRLSLAGDFHYKIDMTKTVIIY